MSEELRADPEWVALANDIRTVDGNHDLGAGALAEALTKRGWTKRAALSQPRQEDGLRSALADVQVGTAAGWTDDRIARVVRDADYALRRLEEGDSRNALAALRRGFQRAPVSLRLAAEGSDERR